MNTRKLVQQLVVIAGVGIFYSLIFSCAPHYSPIFPGLDVLVKEKVDLIRGKRIGILSNRTAISSDGKHIVNVLTAIPEVTVTTLINLEYGKQTERTDSVKAQIDSTIGIATYILHCNSRKLPSEMLQNVDALIFDLQDIGVRFSNDLRVMILAMEATANKGIEFIVLDRPNPLTGAIVEGPVLQPEFKSPLGLLPIPIRHGMTMGELALYINGEGLLPHGLKAKLTVVPAKNWRRMQWFDKTGLQWVEVPSHTPTLEATLLFPGLHLLEGTNITVGGKPDQVYNCIGASWIDKELLFKKLKSYHLYGVSFAPVLFTPPKIFQITQSLNSQTEQCQGLSIKVTDRNVFRSVSCAVYLLSSIHQLYPNKIQFTHKFDLLVGNDKVRRSLIANVKPRRIIASWERELNYFKSIRKKYLLYN